MHFFGSTSYGREVQCAGFIVNHSTAHWDCVFQSLGSDPDLFERMNAACRNRQVDRASADNVPFARIGPPFVKIDLVPTPSQIRPEQSTRQTATNENKSCHFVRIYESGNLKRRKSRQNRRDLAIYPTASDRDGLQFFEGVAQVIQNITGQQRLLALAIVKNRDLGCTPAYPRTDSRRIVQRKALSEQTGANPGENIAHSSCSHSGIACRVVAQRLTALRYDRATAFEQKCYWKTIAEPRRCSGARILFSRKKPSHLTRMRREQPFAFATPQHRGFFRNNVEPVGVRVPSVASLFQRAPGFRLPAISRDQGRRPKRRVSL